MTAQIDDRTHPESLDRPTATGVAAAERLATLLPDDYVLELDPADYEGNDEPVTLFVRRGRGFGSQSVASLTFLAGRQVVVRHGAGRRVDVRTFSTRDLAIVAAATAFALIAD